MKEGDTLAALAIESAAAEFPWSLSQFVSGVLENDDAMLIVVNDEIVGFAIFKPVLDESTLLNIAVHPDHQGKGFGRRLLEQGLKEQTQKGIATCYLEVRASNSNAQALYRSLGFIPVGERKNYYPAKQGREHALVMSRKLPKEALGEI